jgi:hypothetical protein
LKAVQKLITLIAKELKRTEQSIVSSTAILKRRAGVRDAEMPPLQSS